VDTTLVVEHLFMALRMLALVAGPALLTILVVGILIGVIQSATQVNEPSMVFVPKIVALLAVVAIAGPVTLSMLLDYVRELIARIPSVVS
jgi:flagellar biosynthesis protein FliQ